MYYFNLISSSLFYERKVGNYKNVNGSLVRITNEYYLSQRKLLTDKCITSQADAWTKYL